MATQLKSQSLSTEARDWLKGYFDGLYAATVHDHNSLYSVLAHNHSGVYEPANANLQQHISNGAPHSLHTVKGHVHITRQVLVHHINSVTVASGATTYITLTLAGYTGLNGIIWPVAGTFKSLTVRTNSIQPSTGSLVFTLQKGLADTPVVATVPANAPASSNYTSGANTQYFVAGELLGLKVKNNATAASCAITTVSWEFQADTVFDSTV
jgi:hypothetical protein